MSPEPIEITLVRHGQSESNVTGRWQGHGDSPLSPEGRRQAAALAERLRGAHFDRLLSSDLQRAAHTADAVAEVLGQSVERFQTWREIDVGDWEGLTREEVAERFPDQIAALQGGQTIAIGGAESWVDLAERARRAYELLLSELQPGDKAAVFAHGGVIASLVGLLFGVLPAKPRRLGNVSNTAITTLRIVGGEPALVRYNDATHVAPLTSWGQERLEGGATVVGLVPESFTYDAETRAHEGGDLRDALAGLGRERPGDRLGLTIDEDTWRRYAHGILGRAIPLGPVRGATHVVVSEHGQTLADLNVG